VGTRFLAAVESGAHPDYIRALIAARAEDTVYTTAFSGGWAEAGYPDAAHRVLRSSVEAATAFTGNIVGQRPFGADEQPSPVYRLEAVTPTNRTTGTIAAMPLWAGESVSSVRAVQPAREIVRELAEEAERLLRRWG
jgi:nitronate monooxygenase